MIYLFCNKWFIIFSAEAENDVSEWVVFAKMNLTTSSVSSIVLCFSVTCLVQSIVNLIHMHVVLNKYGTDLIQNGNNWKPIRDFMLSCG